MPELQTLQPHEKDLGGGFKVRRLLPSGQRQAVGPFVFFDHFGPITAQPGDNHDVRPHPHIGLATVTYLFEGAMMHRDSTGVVQRIEPGAINLMTAGRGIVHSERTPKDLLGVERRSHGLQLWLAVPAEHEEDAPAFQHVAGAEIPAREVGGALVRVLIGSAFGLTSPVRPVSPTLYLDLNFEVASGATLAIPNAAAERALYSTDHDFELDGELIAARTMVVLEPGTEPVISAPRGGRIMLIGGAPLGHRFIVWNFVSSRRERILQAQDDWEAQRFERVPGETEFIPLPPRHV
ncbi:pirin family protein [Rhizobacter sp. Root404]|uniref:pirin family protein n=1 Tax=Rhizobacter sp. Root404 TaxID=1736528 RepID=UPI0006F65B2A|nr:pirin family protein [Rhizobacter sp. Root404]KQW38306.1 pirin [Rhizobacter sp. Root404]